MENVDELVVEDAIFKGQENSGTALDLTAVAAQIVNCSFLYNRKGSHQYLTVFDLSDILERERRFIGGVIISSKSIIDISQSKFENNRAEIGGVICALSNSIINMSDNVFIRNTAIEHGGVLYSDRSTITIEASEFHSNSASTGGVLRSYSSTITIETSEFNTNTANSVGGVLYSFYSDVAIRESEFYNNTATAGGALSFVGGTITVEGSVFYNSSAMHGGVLNCDLGSTVTIRRSEFYFNSATVNGGVLNSYTNTITIVESVFHDNSAAWRGGVLYSSGGKINFGVGDVLPSSHSITIQGSNFLNNGAVYGGALYFLNCNNITMQVSEFRNNRATRGAAIFATRSIIQHLLCCIDNNSAERYAVVYLSFSEFRGSFITISNNSGSLVVRNSTIIFSYHALFVNNRPPQFASLVGFQQGGAITLLQSNVFFESYRRYDSSNYIIEHNHAENGGAVHATESKIYVNGGVTIANNTATGNGGGIYLSTSELHCQENILLLINNTATHKGGGLHAISSTIRATSSGFVDDTHLTYRLLFYTGAKINFTRNTAELGGGLSLEANARLYILKNIPIIPYVDSDTAGAVAIFTGNNADYGGAVFMDDNTYSGMCASNPRTECFFQVLAIYSEVPAEPKIQSMYFSQNHANISGSTLYGGLLDRCAVSQFAEVYNKYSEYEDNGISYFMNVSNGERTVVSSLPVQVYLCTSIDPNQSNIAIKKGQTFTLSVVAVDQVGQPVNATIQTSLHFTESGLAEGQLARNIPAKCTNLTFNVLSPHSSENLTLYALDGPCRDADLSTTTIEIQFLPCSCPIGLQISGMNSTNCTCECHSNINQYVEYCDSHTGFIVKQPQSRVWISYINDTEVTGYLVYPNCPFDYCLSISPPVDLNQPNGADAQCAFHRSSLLCGSCQSSLSLSLGSSRCLPCPSYWPVLLIAITIAAMLAGIALITLLLVLNMTVAVGTLNGLIFYANIVYANKNILLPFQETNFITIFISWLNLELGIDTCFSPGMDAYMKTWLLLAFPTYVILLVVLVIVVSSYSSRFSNLIGKKDPVATLATLILLSYANLLGFCFKSLSVAILKYPGGSSEMLWLPDATVSYLSGKHIPLLIAAVLILLVGLFYTALLFSWQWLLYLPRWRIFRWSRNPKIQTFIETYHAPYTPKHRYWTGLLLIVRIILYLVATTNVSNDPTVALTAISFTLCCIFALRQFFGSRLYRKWPVDVLETFFYINILSFTIFTWYSLDEPSNQRAAAWTSVIITFIALLIIILYHVYTYTSVFSKVMKMNLKGTIDKLFRRNGNRKPQPKCHRSPPPDDDIHQFYELLDIIDHPINTNDYNVLLKVAPVSPTVSVVEVHQPQLAIPEPQKESNEQKVSVDPEETEV